MTEYIGELNRPMTDILCSVLARGLLRLEGFAMRLHPDAVSFPPFPYWIVTRQS